VATAWELPAALPVDSALAVVPIGRPVPNAQVYLLDAYLQPVPIGVPGEMYIGGAGLARGYLNQPELTQQKFIPHPFRPEPDARLYKTGDLGRFLPDGNIEFLGRRDNQVKVRGYRIELGEIETVLNEHPAVGKGVVMAWDDGAGSKQVAAYVEAAPGHEASVADLRQYLDARLPNYMVPAAIIVLDSIPLTPNDKIDRKRLPHPGQLDLWPANDYVAPRTPLETELADIWARALNRERVGIRDHFFELGGNSLQAALLFIQIEARTGHRLPLATLFQAPTIEQLAAVMADDSWAAPWNPLVPIQPNGAKPPFFCVHGHGGDVVGYHDLARLLGPDQPFYGIQAKGLNGHDEPHTDIDNMVADYVHWVRSVQPHGPYYLGGYCYGGVVAYEMARQLEAAGEEVRLVAVMEGYAVERAEVQKQLWRPAVMWSLLRNLPWWLKDNLHPEGPYLRNWTTLGYNPAAELPERSQVLAAHDEAMAAYRPRPFGGRVTLFRVKTMSLFRSHDPTMGWADVAGGGVDIRMVPGAHYNILEQPHVAGLAEQLRACLAEA
jgi:thioesterase domain-containing protein/acyl carrier protein